MGKAPEEGKQRPNCHMCYKGEGVRKIVVMRPGKGKHHLKSKKDSEKGNMKVIYGAKFKIIKRKNISCWIPFQ